MGGTTGRATGGATATSPMLLPGLAVVRRDEATLQVGLEPGRRVCLPDSPAMRRTLASLIPGPVADPDADFAHPTAAQALAILCRHGLVIDRGEVAAALTTLPDAATRSATTALFAQRGPGSGEALRARAESSVSVQTTGRDPIAATWSATLTDLLQSSGIGQVESQHQVGLDATLLISVGEPDRDLLNRAMGTGEPHLVVAVLDGKAGSDPSSCPGTLPVCAAWTPISRSRTSVAAWS